MTNFNLGEEDFKEKTEAGMAELFLKKSSRQFKYVTEQGVFLTWDEKRWKQVSEGYVRKQILLFTKACYDFISEKRPQDEKWAQKLRSMRYARAIQDYVKAETTVSVTEFDQSKTLLNVQNGILNLETLELLPHNPEANFTNITRARFVRDAKPPAGFLRALFYLVALPRGTKSQEKSENAKRMRYFRRVCSIAFSGEILENIFVILSGLGATGKSTFMELLSYIFGSYSTKLSVKSISGRSAALNDLARLQGKRLVSIAETDEDMNLNAATVKSLTGGDEQTARFLYKEFFQFNPEATFILHTNAEPNIADRSYGMWRRIKLVKSNRMIPEKQRRFGVLKELQSQADAIFSYLVSDIVEYRREGLQTPSSIARDTSRYQEETDPMTDVFHYLEKDQDYARKGAASDYFVTFKFLMFVQNKLADETGGKKMKSNGISRYFTSQGFATGRERVGKRLERGVYGLRPVEINAAA